MKKFELKEILITAWVTGMRYIGVKIETEGSSRPEIIINPRENIMAKKSYYMEAYDDDLVLISAKGKKDIRITGAVAGNTFADIESRLVTERRYKWKQLVSDTIDRVYERMIENTPPRNDAEQVKCETIRENIKTMLFNGDKTELEARFICENIDEYEQLFEICMNGTELELKRGLARMQRKLNAYIVQHENNNVEERGKADE